MKSRPMFLVLLLACVTSNAFGQLLNGDFSNQGDFWDQYRAEILDQGLFPKCLSALSPDAWESGDLLWRGGSNDWAVDLHDGSDFGSDPKKVCGAIKQNVNVVPGANLVFEYKLGTTAFVNPNLFYRDVTLRLDIDSFSGEENYFSDTGVTEEPPCFGSCPTWETASIDVSDLWGQVVALGFNAESSFRRSPFPAGIDHLASPAFVDNIRFEEIPASPSVTPVAGTWFNPNRNGHGINISRSPTGQLQLLWFTYLPSGTPTWFISDLDSLSQGEWNAALNKAVRDPVSGAVLQQPVGSAEIRMLNNSELIFEWNLTAASGSPSQGGEKMIPLHGGDSYTGLWFEPAFDGWGVTLDVEGSGASTVSVATVFFYTPAGEPTWGQGVASGDLTQSVDFNMDTFTGIGLCPGCAGQSQSLQIFPAGSFNLQGMATQPAGFSAIQTAGGISWIRGSAGAPVSLGRLTFP